MNTDVRPAHDDITWKEQSTVRNALTAKRQIIEAIGDLEPDSAVALLRDLVAELDPPNITACSGLTSAWCQVHGDCTCPDPAVALNDPGCPLHAPDSGHASATIQPAGSCDCPPAHVPLSQWHAFNSPRGGVVRPHASGGEPQ